MNYLKLIFTSQEIESMQDTFESFIFDKLDEKNMSKIIYYLNYNNVDCISDILEQYLDLFILDVDDFINKFKKLKAKYGANFETDLEQNLSILEGMYE